MDKVAVKKQQIIAQITQHMVANGLSDLGLRRLAAVAGTSDRMLIYYFGTKDALIGTALQSIAANLALQFDAALGTGQRDANTLLAELLTLGAVPPFDAMIRLWFEVIGLAARGKAPYAENATAIAQNWLAWIQRRLTDADADQAATVFVTLEGTLLLNLLGVNAGQEAL
ncbi:MAG: TetR/AcrR family transcriptional regulator [Caldilineaceae bacterium]